VRNLIKQILKEEKDLLATSPQSLVRNLPKELKDILFKQWGAKQNPEWHPEGNTLKHILVVLRRAYHHYPNDPNMIMAALFHDLGKMDTYNINPKTGNPTAYGHENESTEYVEKFKDWVESFEGTDVEEIKYLVKNHMKVKPSTWDQMRDKKKEPISSHPAFNKLMGFTNKLDGGGTDLKEQIRKVLKEDQFELFGDNGGEYERCSHFENNPQHRKLCYELYTLGSFLYRDLGLKDIIDQKRELMGQVEDLNDKYQEPLEILYNTGKFKEIKKEGNKYYLPILGDRVTVYDEKGEWSYVNKLNTNYADLAELLTELFIRGGVANKLSNKNKLGLKTYLNSIKDKLINVLDKYFHLDEYKEFVRNTKVLSNRGEKAEEDVKKVLEEFGMKTLYAGGHGDFIDMIFGVDLIMDYKGKTYLIQVKNTEDQALKSSGYERYNKLDYFTAPTNFGIIIKNKDGRITKLDNDGQVINEPEEENT